MNTRLLKEFRQLLPVWVAAMMLVTVPFAFLPMRDGFWDGACFAVGLTMLSVACFGREFNQRTFAFLATQPVSREQLWWEKVLVLAVATISVGFTFVLFWKASVHDTADQSVPATMLALYATLAAYGGGLCLTLALRQMLASICFTLMLPIGLLLLSSFAADKWLPGRESALNQGVLIAYAVASFVLARILFLRAQDLQWTGGTLLFPAFSKWTYLSRSDAKGKSGPLTALIRKELQLQQVSFLLAGVLFVLQVMVLLLPKFVKVSEHSALEVVVVGFWILWSVMPLLVGCSAVVEERRLGTLEPQLCLPVSRTAQFAVKTFVTLACGIILGALIPIIIAILQPPKNAGTLPFAVVWILICASATLVSIYVSTLTRQLLQALGTAITFIVVTQFLVNWLMGGFSEGANNFALFGYHFALSNYVLWSGPLVLLAGAGVALVFVMFFTWSRLHWFWIVTLGAVSIALLLGRLQWLRVLLSPYNDRTTFHLTTITTVLVLLLAPVALMLVLASRNFKHVQSSMTLWMRNLVTWACWLLVTAFVATLVFHRFWEIAMQFEPPAESPRLSGSVQPVLTRTSWPRRFFALLPDGRIWSYQESQLVPNATARVPTNQTASVFRRFRPIKNPRSEFLPASNWIALAQMSCEFVAIREDGSLWDGYWWESVDGEGNAKPVHVSSFDLNSETIRPTDLKLLRIGTDSDWVSVASGYRFFVALKQDGTIWGWGSNLGSLLDQDQSFSTNAPVQIGNESDWAAVYAGNGRLYAVKTNETIWRWPASISFSARQRMETGLTKLDTKTTGVSRIYCYGTADLVLDTNGNLWGLGWIQRGLLDSKASYEAHDHLQKFAGKGWFQAVMDYNGIVGIKRDGSLWDWRTDERYSRSVPPPSKLGHRKDWIAIEMDQDSILALAKDGTLCRFGEQQQRNYDLLAPTRRVTWSINVLDASKPAEQ